MKNLTLKNITETCQGTYHGDPKYLDQEADGVVIDSRKVRPGYLFVAIDGVKVNAHKFIPDTVKAGALCVVSHEDWSSLPVRRFLISPSFTETLLTSRL